MATSKSEITVPATITGKFNIALTESKFQNLANEASKLIYNEDNVEKIADFLKRTRSVIKAVEEVHKTGKADIIVQGRQWDTAKNTFVGTVEAIMAVPQQKYTELCQAIQKKQDDQQRENDRILNIKNGITNNAIDFAKRIADCKTLKELTAVESNINLEKTRKEKYQEFLPEAVVKFTELNSLVKTQKVIVKNLEEIEDKRKKALAAGDDATVMALDEQSDVIQLQHEENKTVVQETAINQAMSSDVAVTPTVFPKVAARRTTWKYELVDSKEAMKKAPDLLTVVLNDDKVKTVLQTLKDTKALDGKKELTLNGIRYYENQTF